MRKAAALLSLSIILVASCEARDDSASALPQTTTTADDDEGKAEEELRQIQDEWGEALLARDTSFFARALSEDMTVAGTVGPIGDRAVMLKDVVDTAYGVRNLKVDNLKVRLYHGGTVGVVTGVAHAEFKDGKQYVPQSVVYTETFVKENGRWQAVAAHYSPLNPPK